MHKLTTTRLRREENLGDWQVVEGVNWALYPRIEVDFAWLIGPIVVWVLTTVFLFTTIVLTASREAPIWKSSAVALLYSATDIGGSKRRTDIKSHARQRTARITRERNRWRLRHMERKPSAKVTSG